MINSNFAQADAVRLPFADDTFDLTFTSPPYLDARTYGINAQRGCLAWVEWMLGVVEECCRVTSGLVLVNCAGVTRKWCYEPGPEGLLWEWRKAGGQCWRPCYWNRMGIPGSGGKQWYRADVEYVLAFKSDAGPIAWSDPLANGHPPKWAPGGAMSNRLGDGRRVNQWGGSYDPSSETNAKDADGNPTKKFRPSHQIVNVNQWGHSLESGATVKEGEFTRSKGKRPSHFNVRANGEYKESSRDVAKMHTKRLADGTMEKQGYVVPVLANPGNVVKIIVGGGVMGHPLAHENEAPFPEKLPEFFIKATCPPGGKVLDPFSGSGTTVSAARNLGRIGIGCDLRMNQCELGLRRFHSPMARKVKKVREVKPEESLFELLAKGGI